MLNYQEKLFYKWGTWGQVPASRSQASESQDPDSKHGCVLSPWATPATAPPPRVFTTPKLASGEQDSSRCLRIWGTLLGTAFHLFSFNLYLWGTVTLHLTSRSAVVPQFISYDWHCFIHTKNIYISPSPPSPTWEILVDFIHFQHNIVWHPSLSQQHIKLTRHPACNWVNSKPRTRNKWTAGLTWWAKVYRNPNITSKAAHFVLGTSTSPDLYRKE